jgi:hypothetical protein
MSGTLRQNWSHSKGAVFLPHRLNFKSPLRLILATLFAILLTVVSVMLIQMM